MSALGTVGRQAREVSDYLLKLPGETVWRSVDVVRHAVPAGSEVLVRTPGGGGWGNPFERDVERVRLDVLEEFVSLDCARTDYGVVLCEDGSIDVDGTNHLRRMSGESSACGYGAAR